MTTSEALDGTEATTAGSGRSLLIAATFAAGAGAALAVKSLLESRRQRAPDDQASEEDLPSALRRAALDVALAATNQAAERLSPAPGAEASD